MAHSRIVDSGIVNFARRKTLVLPGHALLLELFNTVHKVTGQDAFELAEEEGRVYPCP